MSRGNTKLSVKIHSGGWRKGPPISHKAVVSELITKEENVVRVQSSGDAKELFFQHRSH